MGFQLGPGFLRRPPKDWLPARAFPVDHSASDWPDTGADRGETVFETSCCLRVTWRVEVSGREPYEFSEERRTAPTWVIPNAYGGDGNRWYKVRLKRTYGLMPGVGVPCVVSPGDPEKIWVDWDKAYDEHEDEWDRQGRIKREVARRDGGFDHLAARVADPFAGKARGDELAEAESVREERDKGEKAREARMKAEGEYRAAEMGFGPVDADEKAEHIRRTDELSRLTREGRPARAMIVSRTDTDRRLANVPVVEFVFDIDDGGTTRRVTFEHVWGSRHANRYKPGKEIAVRIDPADPEHIGLGQ